MKYIRLIKANNYTYQEYEDFKNRMFEDSNKNNYNIREYLNDYIEEAKTYFHGDDSTENKKFWHKEYKMAVNLKKELEK